MYKDYLCYVCVKNTCTAIREPFVCLGTTVEFALKDAKEKCGNLPGDYWLYEIKQPAILKPDWA